LFTPLTKGNKLCILNKLVSTQLIIHYGGVNHEKNLSAKKTPAAKRTRLQKKNGDKKRPCDFIGTPC